MGVPLKYLIAVFAAGLILVVGAGGQTQTKAVQHPPVKPANAWMKVPMDAPGADEVAPYVRHLRDEFWDRLGAYGVLTPATVAHMHGDLGAPADGDPEIPILQADDIALVGTFLRYRTVLTASGRAIYNDVTISVDHVFRAAGRGRGVTVETVTLSIPGGTIRTKGGEVISFLTDPQADFIQPGGIYLLYLRYMAAGEFFVGPPAWDLSDGSAKATGPREKAHVARGESKLVGLTKDKLIRTLDDYFSGKQ